MEITLPYKWLPRSYQTPLWMHLQQSSDASAETDYRAEGARAAVVWHRRAGKDLTMINWCGREAFRRVGLYWHVLPTYRQGRKVVWEGKTRDGSPFLDAFPPSIVERERDDEMKKWFVNGSQYQVVGGDDPDKLVGANPVGIVFSEWPLTNPAVWDLMRPILLENGGWAVFIYTPRGKNHGFTLLNQAKKDPHWFHEVLTVDDTKVVTADQIQKERDSGMPEPLIQQEYYCSFDAPMAGSFYGELINQAENDGRICHVPMDPVAPVSTGWDLGMSDATAIWFYQQLHTEIRFLNYHFASGKGIEYYADVLRKLDDTLGYKYGEHLVPHDARQRSMAAGGLNLVQVSRKLGLKLRVIDKDSLQNGIQATRSMIPKAYFDEDKCETGIQGLREYQREEIEGERDPDGNFMYRDDPKKNWACHPADALRSVAMGRRPARKPATKLAPDLAIA